MRISGLHTYPVKGARRLDHDAVAVEPRGLAGDRRWLVVDPDGVGVTQRTAPGLALLRPQSRPGGLVLRAPGRADLVVAEPAGGPVTQVRVFRHHPPAAARVAAPEAGAWLGGLLDRPVRLVWQQEPRTRGDGPVSFADASPVLLTVTASLAALGRRLRADGADPVPMSRFRPNLVVDGAPAWAEDGWPGRRLVAGGVPFRVVRGCDRCVVTTVDQETGRRGREPLRVLGEYRRFPEGLLFGVLLVPERVSGVVHIGDDVLVAP